jgi:exodeoxyribonuclease V beta subunit
MTSNWRSRPALLHAFNTLFDQSRTPFVFDGIRYHPLIPGGIDESTFRAVLREETCDSDPPMQIGFMDPGNQTGTLNSGEAESFASEACAREITRLLQTGEIQPAEIAVIVRTHRQARLVQTSLRRMGVTGVTRSEETIFASDEATELHILFSAIADPGNEALVRAALVTDLLGRSGNDIDRLNRDEAAWIECLVRFGHYHQLWLEKGFISMARALMEQESVRERLLGLSDSTGQRRLTNVLHCCELLHHQTHERALGVEGLLSWFSEKLATAESADEYQIRLESDDPAVKILTVHVSKGLEFPVVYCPFLFWGVNAGKEVVMFHDNDGRLVKDFGSPEIGRHRLLAEKETLAENMRLFYVALTRAKNRCTLFAGRVVDGRKKEQPLLSPLTWLVHASSEAKAATESIPAAESSVRALDSGAMISQLGALSANSSGAIGFRTMGLPEGEQLRYRPLTVELPEGKARLFSGSIETDWRVSSFTSFSRHERKPAELPDRDEPQAPALPGSEPPLLPTGDRSIFSFPRGARAGILMHAIFEKLDFANATDTLIRELVLDGLARQGYEEEWAECLCRMTRNVLDTPIASGRGTFTLGTLRKESWVTELEFFIPLRLVGSAALGAALARHGSKAGQVDLLRLAESLDFREVRGMLMGFMDMVFEHDGRYWLIDWKSNHLGDTVDDYRAESLKRAMEENLYPLQYLLYTVALNRYLQLRVPGYRYATHCGGVLYLFLRGVTPVNGEKTGFYRDLPPEELIEELTNILVETGGVE